MKTIILTISFLTLSIFNSLAQCNEKLLEIAKSQITENEILLKDFKVKLDAASVNDPVPIAAFSFKLDSAKNYRFRIISDEEENNGEGILRLMSAKNLQGVTYNESIGKHYPYFTFMCRKTDDFKILVTMLDGKKGCAIVLITELLKLDMK